MKPLQDIEVLCAGFVGSDHVLSVWLASEGATLRRCEWDALTSEVSRAAPAVLVADLRNRPAVADLQLKALKASKSTLPIVGLVERGEAGNALAASGSCNKYIAMPAHPADVISAVASLAAMEAASRRPSTLETSLSQLLEDCAERNDLRGFLSLVNSTGPFRFTSILRFDEDERLTSLWTFDRENQTTDVFPLDATVPASYCIVVREQNAPFAMPDAGRESKVANHPKRYSVLSYCGVPLYDEGATMYGTLCSYDVAPRFFAENSVERLEETAAILRRHANVLTHGSLR